jgi:hypothetical protein
MKNSTTIALLIFASLLMTTAGLAQPYLRADHKLDSFRVRSNERHARDQSRTLFHAAQAPKPVPRVEVKDATIAIRRDLEASNKSLAKLEADYTKLQAENAQLKELKEAVVLIAAIKKHNAAAQEQCDMCDKAADKPDGDNEAIADCCGEMYSELEEAEADLEKLLKLLKIEELPAPKKRSKKG